MAQGMKTGGRKKGTPNKRTQELQDRLAELDCDPVEGMARLAMDPNNNPELRGRMYSELAQYVYPKRKAIEHSGDMGVQRYVARMPAAMSSAEEWQAEHAPANVPHN